MESIKKSPLANATAPSRLLIFTGIFLLSLCLAIFTGILLLKPIFGLSPIALPAIINDLENPLAIEVLKFLQFLQGLIAFILPPFIMAWLIERRPAHFLKLNKSATPVSYIMVIVLSLCAIPFINAMGMFNSKMVLPEFLSGVEQWMRESEDKAAKITAAFLDMQSFSTFIYVFTMVAILPAIGEELVFRGVIQRIFKEWTKNVHVSVFITAFLFSAIHMQFFGFIPRFMLGLMLGYLFEWSGSLWLPILAHFVNNGAAVIFAYLAKRQAMSFDPDKLGVEDNILLPVLFSVIVVAALLYGIYKREKMPEIA